MSEVHADLVHRGTWVNLSQGSIMGRTITTDTKTGVIIVSLLAVCTTLASSHLWDLILFALHQGRANGRLSNGLYRQQQALLRTLPIPSSLMIDSVKLLYAWKFIMRQKSKQEKIVYWHSAIHLLIAGLFSAGFVVASIFSSQAVTGSDIEVLVKSPHCGLLVNEVSGILEASSHLTKIRDIAAQYADQCYQDDGVIPARCNIFVTPHVPLTVTEETCPFEEAICASKAVVVDSGLVDLNNAFGLNLKEQDRMRMRRRMTCTILSQENRTSVVQMSDLPKHMIPRVAVPGEEAILYHYGALKNNPKFGEFPEEMRPPVISSLALANMSAAYSVGSKLWMPEWEENDYDIDSMLALDNAQVSLHTIRKNQVQYMSEVEDPVFSAHQRVDRGNTKSYTVYLSDTPATVLGCTVQTQYCLRGTDKGELCTKLSSGRADQPGNSEDILPHANPTQRAILSILEMVWRNSGMKQLLTLEAESRILMAGQVLGLPDDQWKREVKRWGAIDWAIWQTMVADYAIGPGVRESNAAKTYTYPNSTEGKRLCGMQKMRKAGGFVNINVFALAFILSFAAFVTILDLVLLRCLIFVGRFKSALSPRVERWIQDGIFQLQRHLYESRGQGNWERLETQVPITKDDVRFADLPADSASTSSSVSVVVARPKSPSIRRSSSSVVYKRGSMISDMKRASTEGTVDIEASP